MFVCLLKVVVFLFNHPWESIWYIVLFKSVILFLYSIWSSNEKWEDYFDRFFVVIRSILEWTSQYGKECPSCNQKLVLFLTSKRIEQEHQQTQKVAHRNTNILVSTMSPFIFELVATPKTVFVWTTIIPIDKPVKIFKHFLIRKSFF